MNLLIRYVVCVSLFYNIFVVPFNCPLIPSGQFTYTYGIFRSQFHTHLFQLAYELSLNKEAS